MRKNLFLTSLLVLLVGGSLAACQHDDDNTLATGHYLFEIEFYNNAFTYQRDGLFFNEDGEVWSYDVTPYQAEYESTVAATDFSDGTPAVLLEQKYAYDPVLVDEIDGYVLRRSMYLLFRAYEAPIEQLPSGSADMGVATLRGWLYDPVHDTYREVFVASCLDVNARSTSEDAEAFFRWLADETTLPYCNDIFDD